MKVKRKIIHIDEVLCNGCGQCSTACAEQAIQIVDGKARLISDQYCDGLGACLGECPQGALKIIERDADEFDEAAVEQHLQKPVRQNSGHQAFAAGGCPSAQVKILSPSPAGPGPTQKRVSELSHWPVQIRLVQPGAAFLKNAELLIAADCTPIAYPDFHGDFLRGKAVMIGCPKFDDAPAYIEKFAQIFRAASIKSVTVVVMEVPCCQSLPVIVYKGMKLADIHVPIEKIVISAGGEILKREKLAA